MTDVTQTSNYVNGVDYLLTTNLVGGLQIARTGGSSIPDGATVLVSYTWSYESPCRAIPDGDGKCYRGQWRNDYGQRAGLWSGLGHGPRLDLDCSFLTAPAPVMVALVERVPALPWAACVTTRCISRRCRAAVVAQVKFRRGRERRRPHPDFLRWNGGTSKVRFLPMVRMRPTAAPAAVPGGSISITATNITGLGNITADGGAGEVGHGGGGGGGGMISLQCFANSFSGSR